MRWVIRIFVLGALATGLTLLASLNSGYVLVALPGHRIELSLNFALILAVAGFVAAYILVRLLVTTLELPGRVARFRAGRRSAAAHDSLVGALRDYFAGRYARAERKLNRAVDLGEPADIGAVIAASAAHELRAPERRDRYLAGLTTDPAKPDAARAVSEARMLLDERRAEDALAALAVLPKKHTAALRLELRARQRLEQWDMVPALVDQLEKRGVFGRDRADTERSHAWRQLLERETGDAAGLAAVWKRVPDRYRRDIAVASAAATAFHALGRCTEAQEVIERCLDVDWDSRLVTLYGECSGPDTLRQIERAERWLKDHREDAALLLALGRLCARQQLWGKAQNYLEASIAVEPTYVAHLELARLHEHLERPEVAALQYRAGLDIAVSLLNRMSGGRREKLR
jgi:HemY protein